jgi:hypothetical protein
MTIEKENTTGINTWIYGSSANTEIRVQHRELGDL